MAAATAAGVDPGAILLDPGLGFGKTVEQNLELVSATPELLKIGRPLLSGLSRKSFTAKAAGLDLITHQLAEEEIRIVPLAALDLEEGAGFRIEGGLPELGGVHLAEAFVALERQALPAGGEHGLEKIAGTVDDGLLVLAAEPRRAGIDRLQRRRERQEEVMRDHDDRGDPAQTIQLAEPISAAELQQAKNQFARDYILSRESNKDKAQTLAHAAVIHDDITTADGEFDIFMNMTAAEVQRVARKYFTAENRLVLTVMPRGAGGSRDNE